MIIKGMFKTLALTAVIIVSGCVSIPQESVTLNKEVAAGITSIHESNIRFINQYFELKMLKIDQYEKEAIDNFFNKIASATTKPGVPPLGAHNLHAIKDKVEEIHATGTKFKAEINASKAVVIEKVQAEYNLIISANNSITGLLQSAVDIDEATNDGLLKAKELTDGKIDLTDIDSKIDEYLAKLGTSSAQASSLVDVIKETFNSDKGDK